MTNFRTLPANTSLRLNQTADDHHVIERGEGDGVQDLHKLAQDTSVEEGWFFVSGVRPDGSMVSRWYEVGEHEKGETHDFSLGSAQAVIDDVRKENITVDRWRYYHFHPAHKQAYQAETPSEMDARALVWLAARREEGLWVVPPAEMRVVTPSGLWTLRMKGDLPAEDSPANEQFLAAYAESVYNLMMDRVRSVVGCIDGPCTLTAESAKRIVKILTTAWTEAHYDPLPPASPK